MDVVKNTRIWRCTLAEVGPDRSESDSDAGFRSRLRQAFLGFRERAGALAGEIPQDLRQLTVHDLTHIDALWQIADMIVGDEYPFTPTEAFVLGGAFMLHDLGMALASYPDGLAELRKDTKWRDAAVQLFRRKNGRMPRPSEMSSLGAEIEGAATEEVLRLRHAEQAGQLAKTGYRHANRDSEYYLIDDVELRDAYGELIGSIAHSHWLPARDLPGRFDKIIGAFPGSPADWTIDRLKLALVLRVADACHLDGRRAPGFLRALRKPSGVSERHWRFQEYLQTPHVNDRRLEFSASKDVPLDDAEAWWLAYEMLNLADHELCEAKIILRDKGKKEFLVDSISGADDPTRLVHHMPTSGWKPIPTTIRVGDVAGLVRSLGGSGLYGDNPRVPLRELIQNARDAVVARRIKEGRDRSWGGITVRLVSSGGEHKVEVQDTGLGMSEELLVGPLLDFGTSYWNTPLMLREHPGLTSRGFEPQGRFGIGFFSVFMWGDRVKVVTRRPEDGIESTRVLEFCKGLASRPVLRPADPEERLLDPGTVVHIWPDRRANESGGFLAPGPIEFWSTRRHRETEWRLKDLCAWLCPAIDVNLLVDQEGNRETSVNASDWETISSADLLHRLILHRDDCESILNSQNFKTFSSNIREIRDESGTVLGRAAFKRFFHFAATQEDPLNQASTVTAGCFRSIEQMDIIGLLLGHPDRPTRASARPIAFDCPEALINWASGQSDLVRGVTEDMYILHNYTSIIRLFGGDTKDLPIARSSAGPLSFNDIARSRDLPNEIRLMQELWGVAGGTLPTLPTNAIAVGQGRGNALYDPLFDHDPRRRADHPHWRRFWMSLWGATIEAIAQGWGVPLQAVLEASEISDESMHDAGTIGGKPCLILNSDIIRKPRGTGTR